MKTLRKFFSLVLPILLLTTLLHFTTARAAVTIYYVNADASGTNNGTSWTNAYTDLQPAIAATPSGSEIWVAAGTYKPTSSTDRTISFVLKNGVAIYGGFAGTETQRSQRNLTANPTILSGDIGTLNDTSDNTYHVVTAGGTNTTAVLNGFTVTTGNANGDISQKLGGGIYIEGLGSPSFANLIISNNHAVDFGGGMYIKDGNLSLTNVQFVNNSVSGGGGGDSKGGGIANISGDLILKSVSFKDNTAANAGGGVFNSGGDLTLTNVTFQANDATYIGGGMDSQESTLMMTDVTFDSNEVGTGNGGAISLKNTNLTMTNGLFKNNSASNGGGGISSSWSTKLNLTNTTFTGNTADTGDGGAIEDSSNSQSTVTSSTFIGNSAGGNGGAIDINEHPYTINNAVFKDNTSGANGGALSMFLNNSAITNVLFNHNSAVKGGAVFNQSSHSTFENITFVNNSANKGGAIYNYSSGSPTFTNITFSGNSAGLGSAIYNEDTSIPVIKSSIFWDTGNEIFNQNASTTITSSMVRGGCPAQSNCTQVISGNPLLSPLANNGGFSQTMALSAGSPALDIGDAAACPKTDQRGVARIQGPGCDMGAYEKKQSSIKLLSQAANDGWIVESSQGSGTGGSLDTALPYIIVGDDIQNSQIRSIVSFDTGSLSLPTNAILSGATLKVKLQGVVGGNPIPSFGNLLVDARKGPFNANATLELADFNFVANSNIINTIPPTPVDGFYTVTWLKNIVPSLDGAGPTQMRLRFEKSTNKNQIGNGLKFYSGDAATAANRPQLIVYYYLP